MAFTASTWGQGRLLTGLSPGSSLSGFTAVITKANLPTSALDTGSLSCLNGGGDWRFSTDINGSTQLPCQIVTCVTNATAGNTEFESWIRFPTYASGTREVYAFWNKAGQSQPLVGAAFGRNAVWADSVLTAHLNEAANNTAGGYTNSTGGTNGTGTSMSLANPSAPYGDDFSGFGGEPDFIDFPLSAGVNELTISFWANPDDLLKDQRALSIYKSPIGSTSEEYFATWMDTGGTGKGWAALIRDAGAGVASVAGDNDSNATAGVFQLVSIYVSTTTVSTYKNGVLGSTLATVVGNDLNLSTNITIGRLWNRTGTGSYFNGGIGGVDVVTGDARNKLPSEYSNQNNPSTFWTAGAVFVPGGTTITVTESGPSFTDSIASTVTGSITASIVGLGPSFSDSISVNVASAGTISASIAETGPSFTDSISSTVTGNISASIVSAGPSFTDSVSITVTGNITTSIVGVGPSFTDAVSITVSTPQLINTSIVESGPSFIESILMSTPTPWVDKAPATTVWTDSTISSTIWQDK
jgi:hypothetical protein